MKSFSIQILHPKTIHIYKKCPVNVSFYEIEAGKYMTRQVTRLLKWMYLRCIYFMYLVRGTVLESRDCIEGFLLFYSIYHLNWKRIASKQCSGGPAAPHLCIPLNQFSNVQCDNLRILCFLDLWTNLDCTQSFRVVLSAMLKGTHGAGDWTRAKLIYDTKSPLSNQ